MSSPASGSLRGLRVAAVAVAGTVLAAAAHVAAGGSLPSPGSVAVAAVIPGMSGLWITGRRRGWLSIAAALGAVQVVLHTWFMAGTAGSCLVSGDSHLTHVPGGVDCSASGMAAMAGNAAAAGTSSQAAVGWHLAVGGSAMFLAHVLAVVVTALVLAAGERALWQLVAWLRPALRAACAAAPAVVDDRRVPVVVALPVRRLPSADLGGPGRRGPPVTA